MVVNGVDHCKDFWSLRMGLLLSDKLCRCAGMTSPSLTFLPGVVFFSETACQISGMYQLRPGVSGLTFLVIEWGCAESGEERSSTPYTASFSCMWNRGAQLAFDPL